MPDDDNRLGILMIPDKGFLASLGILSIGALLSLGVILLIIAACSGNSYSSSDFSSDSINFDSQTSLEEYCAQFGDLAPEVCE